MHKIDEVELDGPDHTFSLDNVAINTRKKDIDCLYNSSREDLSNLTCSSEGPRNDSYDSDYNIEEVTYRDDESTDEDESLPTPDRKRKKIGHKACEILDSKRIGIKVPKLYVWSLSDKPFSVIDGLCTKSLYPLSDDINTPESLSSCSSSVSSRENQKGDATFDNDAMIADLLNIGGLEVEKASNGHIELIGEWLFDIPEESLSSFKGKYDRLRKNRSTLLLELSENSRKTYLVSEDQLGISYDEMEKNLGAEMDGSTWEMIKEYWSAADDPVSDICLFLITIAVYL